jgi:hypothetical protein
MAAPIVGEMDDLEMPLLVASLREHPVCERNVVQASCVRERSRCSLFVRQSITRLIDRFGSFTKRFDGNPFVIVVTTGFTDRDQPSIRELGSLFSKLAEPGALVPLAGQKRVCMRTVLPSARGYRNLRNWA